MKIHQKIKVVSVSDNLITATTLITGDPTEVRIVNIATGKLASDAEAKALNDDRVLSADDKKKKNLHLKFRRQTVKTMPIVTISIAPKFGEELKIKSGDTLTLTIN